MAFATVLGSKSLLDETIFAKSFLSSKNPFSTSSLHRNITFLTNFLLLPLVIRRIPTASANMDE